MAAQTIIDKIKELLEANVHERLKKPFYLGDPIAIPASRLPTIAIEPSITDISSGATGQDEHIHTIIIKIITDKRKDFNKSPEKVLAVADLIDWAEGIDSDTGELKTTSVAGILRKYLTLENEVVNQLMSIEYGVVPREEFLTAEAWITLTDIKSLILVSGRE